MSYLNALDEARRQLRLRDRLILGLIALLAVALGGWHLAPTQLRVDVQPGLTSRVSVRPGEIPAANVHTFAAYLLQQLYRWPSDGSRDYPERVARLAPYWTAGFRAYLDRDARERARFGELRGRTRIWRELETSLHAAGSERVRLVRPGLWEVTLDAEIEETLHGQPVKAVRLRYVVRVLAQDVDPESNPWGLMIAGFAGEGPVRLEDPS